MLADYALPLPDANLFDFGGFSCPAPAFYGRHLSLGDQWDEEIITAVTLDLLQRAGKFREASAFISDKEVSCHEEPFKKILRFQKVLIEKWDTARHTMRKAVEEKWV